MIAANLEQHCSARTQEACGCLCRACQHDGPSGPTVNRCCGFVGEHIARQKVQLIAGYVGDNGRHEVDGPAKGSRQRLIEVADQCLDSVCSRARNRGLVETRGDDGGLGMSGAKDHRDRATTGAQVDCNSVMGQESSCPPRQLLGVRSWHEDSGIDADTDATEADEPGDPRKRFSLKATSDQPIDRPRALGRCFYQRVRLGFWSKETSLSKCFGSPFAFLVACLIHVNIFTGRRRSASSH